MQLASSKSNSFLCETKQMQLQLQVRYLLHCKLIDTTILLKVQAFGALIAAVSSSVRCSKIERQQPRLPCYQLECESERECAFPTSFSSILSADAGVCAACCSRNLIEKHVHTRAATQTKRNKSANIRLINANNAKRRTIKRK